jgi:DNA invertase Pin-like site-specific DNA recombinase
MKRLAPNAAELMGLSAALEAGGIQLELLTGPLTGVHDPNGMGAMLFAVLAVAAQLDREYIREKTSKASRPPRPRPTTADGPK